MLVAFCSRLLVHLYEDSYNIGVLRSRYATYEISHVAYSMMSELPYLPRCTRHLLMECAFHPARSDRLRMHVPCRLHDGPVPGWHSHVQCHCQRLGAVGMLGFACK